MIASVGVVAMASVFAGMSWFLSCLTFFIKHYELNENTDAQTSYLGVESPNPEASSPVRGGPHTAELPASCL